MPDPNDLKNLSSQLKKTIIFAKSFKGGSSVDPSKNILNIQKTTIGLAGHVIQLVSIVSDLAKIVNNNSKKITSLKNISKSQSSRISGKNIGAKLPGSSTSNVEDNISKITKSVISIAEILSGQKKLKDSSTSYDRRKAEQEKRSLAESKLEKRFDGLKKAAEKILAPVKSLLDKIINFLVTVFLGRVVYKLLEWFGDPKNADKVRTISRFLGDHWPKLLALYLTFGTSVGRFALGLTRIVAKGAIKLLAKILLLTKAKKLRAAGRFLGGKGGNIAGAVLGTAAAVGGAYALTQGLKGDDEEPKTLKPEEPKIPGYAGGGIIKIPKFAGGGLNFKGMFGGALGSSPEKPQEMPNGFVSGEKGVDKVPAMLSDGEFVMSVGAVQKYGVDTLEGMNAAGGGTNRPKMMNGKTYAEGGGMMGMRSGGVKGLTMEERAQQAHGTAVRIETGGPPGSGVLVKNDNGKYTVLTSGHVIDGSSIGEEMAIITRDGKKHIIKRSDKNTQRMEKTDMGSLTFSSKNNYPVAERGDPTKVKPGDSTFVGGFPINPKTGLQDSTLRFSTGKSINPTQTDKDSQSKGFTQAYSNQTQSGMSGGAVYNAQGQVTGIHGRGSMEGTLQGSRAVPIDQYGGQFGSTAPVNPRPDTKLSVIKLTERQESQAEKTAITGGANIPDYGSPGRGDQYLVGPGSETNKRLKQGFKGGGIIRENTGIDIPGGGADRQNVRVQPGEYIIPKKVVDTVGVNLLDKRVANIDKNSNPSKLGAYKDNNDLSYRQKQATIAKTNPSIKSVSPPVKRDSGGYSAPIGANGSNSGGRRSASVGSQTPSFSSTNSSGSGSKQKTLGLMR